MSIVITERPPGPVPATVTPLQARRALRAASLLTAIETYVDTDLTGALREEWDYAVLIERDSPLIEDARVALQMTVAQIDDLFRLAATL